jgi:hypothetical protein
VDKIPNSPIVKHVPQFENSAKNRVLGRIVKHEVIHNGVDEGQPFEPDEIAEEGNQIVDAHLASLEGDRTHSASHLFETWWEFLDGETVDWCYAEVELLNVGEGREMYVMFYEQPCFGQVGMVMEDNDVGRRSVVPWSNVFAPFGKTWVCEAHLVEQMLLAAVQPIWRYQGAVLERGCSCRFIVGEVVDNFVHDFLGKLDSHNCSGVSGIGRRGDVGKDEADQQEGHSAWGLDGYKLEI